jgi:hypothetical protein
MCRYGYVKNGQKQSKTDKNEHEIGKGQKTKPRKKFFQEKPKRRFYFLNIQRMTKGTLGGFVKLLT